MTASKENLPTILLTSASFIFLLFFYLIINYPPNDLKSFFNYNTSLFSILIAAHIAFCIPIIISFYYSRKSKIIFAGFSFATLLALILLVSTNGRAGWLGLIIAIGFIIYTKIKRSKHKKIFICCSLFCTVIFASFLYWYKVDSSNGRLLIYKVSYKIFVNNPVFGVGFGRFKATYNNYQANYFTTNSIDSKEALLADNTFYAFNEYYQFLIEFGIVGFIVLLLLGFLFFKYVWCSIKEPNPLTIAAKASLFSILVSALFSYPFHSIPICILALLCFASLVFIKLNELQRQNNATNLLLLSKIVSIAAVLITGLYFCLKINYAYNSSNASEFSRSGFRGKAIEKYKELSTSIFNDGNDLFLYAKELYYSNKLSEAKTILDKAKTEIVSSELYKLSAAVETELKNFKQAETELKTVVYMVPNRMQSRMNLLNFYVEQRDSLNIRYWAKSIINMPVKIESETTKALQNRAIQILAHEE